ncbi:MAG: T9SS type A sorting domain-containing protein [Bacteroidetes bacterium]|nr:T9SS type A sorting domain-containing protein [Bacteroidota bacterium]
MYNYINMNLSVINWIVLGEACDLQPFSFFLGGKRAYAGLPNNPDYDLGPLVGSACDSLTAVQENELINTNATLNLYFNHGWKTLFVNAQNLKGTKGTIKIYDTQGNIMYTSPCSIQSPYFTKDTALPGLAQGVYVVHLQTEKEILNRKFVK